VFFAIYVLNKKKIAIAGDVLKLGDVIEVDGKEFIIEKPTQKGKRLKASPRDGIGPSYNFGDSEADVQPYTKKGHSYCNRSYYINSKKISRNTFSRLNWGCKGKKSKR